MKMIRKIVFISLILVMMFGIGVIATKAELTNVVIEFSDKYQLEVVTSKIKVADILEENNIIVLEDETVYPALEENISATKKIKIYKKDQTNELISEEVGSVAIQEILDEYSTIVEKIIVEHVEIPFETITKDVSNNSEEKLDRVLQQGENGIREVKYRVKYQNDIEIERVEISSVVIKEPKNKIVQLSTRITSRSGGSTISYSGGRWTYTEAELDLMCAITRQEGSRNYEASLAVITCACNRAERRGTDPLSEYKRKNQFCYSLDNHWRKFLGGNYPDYVRQAVIDALNGARNHNFTSFRSAWTGRQGVNIGGNVYF